MTSFLNKNVYGLKNCRGFDFITIDDEERKLLFLDGVDGTNVKEKPLPKEIVKSTEGRGSRIRYFASNGITGDMAVVEWG